MDYELGLSQLHERLTAKGLGEEEWRKYFTLEARLWYNLERERIMGSEESLRSERAHIICALNSLALKHLQASFNELCFPEEKETGIRGLIPPFKSRIPYRHDIRREYVGDRHERYGQALAHYPIIGIWGEIGCGKTWTAAQIAMQWEERGFPFLSAPEQFRQVLWYDCQEGNGAYDLLYAIAGGLVGLGISEATAFQRWLQNQSLGPKFPVKWAAGQLLDLLKGRQCLLCMDDFHLVNPDQDEVRQLFEELGRYLGETTVRIILISRQKTPFARFSQQLPTLPHADVQELLVQVGEKEGKNWLTHDIAAGFVQRLRSDLNMDMKAVSVLAVRWLGENTALEEAQEYLCDLGPKDIAQVVLDLGDQRADLLLVLAALEGWQDRSILRRLPRLEAMREDLLDNAVASLVKARLVEVDEGGKCRLHDTVRHECLERAGRSRLFEPVHERMGQIFQEAAEETEKAKDAGLRGSSYWQAVQHYVKARAYARVIDLLMSCAIELIESGKARQTLALVEKIAQTSAREGPTRLDPRQRLRTYILRSYLAGWLGDLQAAEGAARNGLAKKLQQVGDGEFEYERAWLFARLGISHADMGDMESAVRHLQMAEEAMQASFDIERDLGKQTLAAYELIRVRENLYVADLLRAQGEPAETRDQSIRQIIDRLKRLRRETLGEGADPRAIYLTARLDIRLAQAYYSESPLHALEYAQEGLKLFDLIQHEWGIGFANSELGRIHMALGGVDPSDVHYLRSAECYRIALERDTRFGDKEGMVLERIALGELCLITGNLRGATENFVAAQQALGEELAHGQDDDYVGDLRQYLQTCEQWRDGIRSIEQGQQGVGEVAIHQALHTFRGREDTQVDAKLVEISLRNLGLRLPPLEMEMPSPMVPTTTLWGTPTLDSSCIGRYQIQEELGRGAMSIVYKAYDPHVDRFVVLKVLQPILDLDARSGDLVRRFRREAQAIGKLIHPNIVRVYDADIAAGRSYIVMEYLKGKTLAEVIAQEGPQPLGRVVDIVGQVCAALSYAHTCQVIHRDIKPSNLILLEAGQVKIVDFGLASIATALPLTREGDFLGTLCYASPEQIRASGDVDGRSDLFSLGVVAYELLTGERLFPGESPTTIHDITCPEPADLSGLQDRAPSARPVLERALAKDPSERYATCAGFAEALSQLRATGG